LGENYCWVTLKNDDFSLHVDSFISASKPLLLIAKNEKGGGSF
jgi:hypothetical protein